MQDGRKIPNHIENHFDNVIIEIARWININIFRPLNATPNIITTLSLFAGVASIVAFYKAHYLTFAALSILAYILDCADGNFARTYNMITRFGDIYDHVSDMLKLALLFIVIIISPIDKITKITVLSILVILNILMLQHLGCQELHVDSNGEALSLLKKFCKDTSQIKWTRYFGTGTMQVFIACFGLYMAAIRCHSAGK